MMKAKVQKRFRRGQRGQALVEYVILIAVVALAALFVLGAFSDRLREMIAGVTNTLGGEAEVDKSSVSIVKELKADAILRGLRAFSDFEYELQMALMNRELLKGCETIFLTPQLENSYVSSTLIKEVARLGADFTAHVPPPVARALDQRRERL